MFSGKSRLQQPHWQQQHQQQRRLQAEDAQDVPRLDDLERGHEVEVVQPEQEQERAGIGQLNEET